MAVAASKEASSPTAALLQTDDGGPGADTDKESKTLKIVMMQVAQCS